MLFLQKDLKMEYFHKSLIMIYTRQCKLINEFFGTKTIFLHPQKKSKFSITSKQRKPYKMYIKINSIRKINNKKSPCEVKRN